MLTKHGAFATYISHRLQHPTTGWFGPCHHRFSRAGQSSNRGPPNPGHKEPYPPHLTCQLSLYLQERQWHRPLTAHLPNIHETMRGVHRKPIWLMDTTRQIMLGSPTVCLRKLFWVQHALIYPKVNHRASGNLLILSDFLSSAQCNCLH